MWEGLIYKDSLFVLTTDETITLDTTSINYEKYKGAEEGAKKFKGNIVGDDATKVFTITHGLNTKDVVIKVYDATTDEQVYFSTKIVSENAIEVSSDVVLTPSDSFNVLVIG